MEREGEGENVMREKVEWERESGGEINLGERERKWGDIRTSGMIANEKKVE